MEIIDLILSKKWDMIEKSLDDTNINSVKHGFNLLWLAINGACSRPSIENTDFADYNTVNLLLNKGIVVNKKCVLMTYLYTSIFHQRHDISKLLLMFGADPNEYSVLRVKHKKMICDVPLNVALRKFDVEGVELLVTHGALYNNVTIEKIEKGIKLCKKDKKYEIYNDSYKKLCKILSILKKNYTEYHEKNTEEYIKSCGKTGVYDNFFPCFQYLTV